MEPGNALAVVAEYDLTAVVPVTPELWVVGAGLTGALVGILLVGGTLTRATSDVTFLLFTTMLFGPPNGLVLAHISLFGLVSALLVTGGGPLSINRALSNHSTDDAESDGDASRWSAGV